MYTGRNTSQSNRNTVNQTGTHVNQTEKNTCKSNRTHVIPTGHMSIKQVDPESVRFRFRYFSQIQIWTLMTSKSPVSSIKYQDENNNR